MIVGYASYYFVRQNLSIVMPLIRECYKFSLVEIGTVFTVFSFVYGIGKFFNGFITDRYSARVVFAIGLGGASIVSILFSQTSSIIAFTWLAGLLAWFQSMGWPPIVKLITRWYPPNELGTKWGFTNMSHQIGSVIMLAGGPYLVAIYGWGCAFSLPGILMLGMAVILFILVRNTPQDAGLPPTYYEGVDETETTIKNNKSIGKILKEDILCNKYVWFTSFATFCLYIVRMGFFFWAPMFLQDVKGITLIKAGWATAGFEIAGAVGGICAGWISDKWFQHQRGFIGAIFMLLLIGFLVYFWLLPAGNAWSLSIVMLGVGFLVYGAQVITGVIAAQVVSKHAVSSAVGLTGTFGYIASSLFSGTVIGKIVDAWGWNICFIIFIFAATLGAFFFSLTWTRKSPIPEMVNS